MWYNSLGFGGLHNAELPHAWPTRTTAVSYTIVLLFHHMGQAAASAAVLHMLLLPGGNICALQA
jgi:hypothetical protein